MKLFASVHTHVLWTMGGVLGLLVMGTVASLLVAWRKPGDKSAELRARVRTWWIMAGMFICALLVGRIASVVFIGFLSFLALKEYLSLIPTRRADRRVLFWAYLAIPIQFYWVGSGWYGMFAIFIPVYMFLILPMRMVLIGETHGFLNAAGTLHWGLMLTVYSLSHAAALLTLPAGVNPVGGGPGLLLFLILLTELNDVAQYVWGKSLGRIRVIPKVSPNKTVAGLLGGVGTTMLLAWLLAPLLTPMQFPVSLAAGALIGIGGFIGDVTISALKRDLGIKDSGSILPGHGGILDRVDSLTYTAPLFFHFVRYLFPPN